jgi:hypothetical protein
VSQRALAFLLTLATLLPFAASAYALDSADEWDQQIDSNGTITLSDGTILIEGSNNAGPEYPWQNTVTGLTTDSSVGETVSFDWAYWTTDGAFYDRAQMLLDESWIDLAIWDQAGYNPLQQSGSQSVYIAAGGIFGFRILSVDSCCGSGFLQVNNTTWVVGSPTPSPTASPDPTPTPTPDPTPEPSPSPTEPPTPEPTVEPSPEPTPEPTPAPTPELTPEPTPDPTPEPTPEPTPSPEVSIEPTPTPGPTNSPAPSASPQPTETPAPETPSPSPTVSPDTSPIPTPEPEQSDLPPVAEAIAEVAGAAVAAAADFISDIAAITELGKDLDETEREEAQPVAVAIVSSQIASIAAAAANAARQPSNNGGGGGGAGGGEMGARSRKVRR